MREERHRSDLREHEASATCLASVSAELRETKRWLRELERTRTWRLSAPLRNLSGSVRLTRRTSLFVQGRNIFNEPQRTFRGYMTRLERVVYNGPTMTFGVSGRF